MGSLRRLKQTPWLRLTTFNAANLPNPIISATLSVLGLGVTGLLLRRRRSA